MMLTQLNIDWEHPSITVLALALCGYVLANFVFLRDSLNSGRGRGVLRSAAIVAIVHAAVLLPFAWTVRSLTVVAAAVLAHSVFDNLRIVFEKKIPQRALLWFFVGHLAQVAALVFASLYWPRKLTATGGLTIGWIAALIALLVFNANGASAIVARVLAPLDTSENNEGGPSGAGMRIGILERWLILGLVSAGQWGAVGLVLTAKSIARFEKMNQQKFAEIYLIGTMTSVLIAMVSAFLFRLIPLP